MPSAKPKSLKYLEIYNALSRDISSGRWGAGARLPSESELVKTFGVSRITVSRAMRDLQNDGIVERRAGAGSFVRQAAGAPIYSLDY